MLNIRINVTIDPKKLAAKLAVIAIVLGQFWTPAEALPATTDTEKAVTVSLTYLTVTTTKSAALKAISSPYSKYFDAQTAAFLTVYAKGWKLTEWQCLNNLWNSESHFNPKALNMSSHAFGIAQFLPTTWGNYKVSKTASAQLQIKYGLNYIQKRYGSTHDTAGACNAWRFHQQHGWY